MTQPSEPAPDAPQSRSSETRHRRLARGVPPGPATKVVVGLSVILTIVSWREPGQVYQVYEALGVWGWPLSLLLATLLHASPLHLMFNGFWVWRWMPWFVRQLGGGWTLGGVACLAWASAVPQWFLDGPGIGLSGVVYGWWGFLFMRSRAGQEVPLSPGDTRLFVGWGLFCVVATELGWLHIANIAHGAGAVAGLFCGWIANRLGWGAVH